MGQQDEREAFRWYSDNWPLLYRVQKHDAGIRVRGLAALLARARAEGFRAGIEAAVNECKLASIFSDCCDEHDTSAREAIAKLAEHLRSLRPPEEP